MRQNSGCYEGGKSMRVIGVTGGVGSGKSAVLNYIEAHFDARIVKADEVGHMLMMPWGKCFDPVVQLFGDWVVREDGSLDRQAIAQIVFKDPEMLKKLNACLLYTSDAAASGTAGRTLPDRYSSAVT